ncbi:L-lactate permease [Acinetobacter baumannii]
MDGWRGVKETWPAVLVGGGCFAIAQYLTSLFIGPELPDITASNGFIGQPDVVIPRLETKTYFPF